MADNTNTQDQGTQGQVQDQGGAGRHTLPAKVYPTKADAEAAKPADAPKSLEPFEVFKAGASVGWVLARGYDHGLAVVARSLDYAVSTGKATAPVTKEAVAAKLATFTDDELAAMGLSRTPAAAGTAASPAAAAVKPQKGGKK